MKAALAIVCCFAPMWALAGGFAPGTWAGFNDAMAQQRWADMSRAWTNCMNRGGGDSCGPAPEPPAQRQPNVRPKQTDQTCVSRCLGQGYQYGLCESRCSW